MNPLGCKLKSSMLAAHRPAARRDLPRGAGWILAQDVGDVRCATSARPWPKRDGPKTVGDGAVRSGGRAGGIV